MDVDMTNHTDIDTLIAALHPHIVMSQFEYCLNPPPSLQPSKHGGESRSLARALATLYRFHRGCNAAAVAPRAPQPGSGKTSFYVCPSPTIPPEFENNLEKWIAHFNAMCKNYNSMGNAHLDAASISPCERRFILYTYELCYPSMYQQIVEHGFGDWNSILNRQTPVPGENIWTPAEEEVRLTQQYADELRAFSDRVQRFAKCVSRDSLGGDEDVLRFHKLCMEIKGMRSNPGFLGYLNEYIRKYLARFTPRLALNPVSLIDCAVKVPGLTYFNLPLAVSDIIALSRNAKMYLDSVKTWVILDSSKGARRFSAVMTETSLAERFREGEHRIRWKAVMAAFKRNWEVGLRGYGTRYQWDAENNIFSTAGPVPLHPEIALIQHLLERGDRGAKAHIACSRTPCYATGVYAVAVNKSLGTRFTMDVDDPEWCQLDEVEPWILPEDAPSGVVARMREHLLRVLDMLAIRWEEERGFGVDYDTIARYVPTFPVCLHRH